MTRRNFADLPGWSLDDHAPAMRAFLVGARAMAERTPTSRSLGPEGHALARLGDKALSRFADRSFEGEEARGFFEEFFAPQHVGAEGFLTGYFEPVAEARREPDDAFTVPLYRRPDDLVEVPAGTAVPELPEGTAFARRRDDRLVAYHDRSEIEEGALAGRGLEIAWLKDPIEAFFIHVQGCATLVLPGGQRLRVTYDGKSGHPYTSIGRVAVRRGLSEPPPVDKERLEAWLRADMGRAVATMRENRSYIFFRETDTDPVAERWGANGPVAAARVPLTPGRSLAVDHRLWTFHAPIVVHPRDPFPDESRPLARLMIAQDTGSAIRGPARGDVFCGIGDAAGRKAGRIATAAEFFRLVPRGE